MRICKLQLCSSVVAMVGWCHVSLAGQKWTFNPAASRSESPGDIWQGGVSRITGSKSCFYFQSFSQNPSKGRTDILTIQATCILKPDQVTRWTIQRAQRAHILVLELFLFSICLSVGWWLKRTAPYKLVRFPNPLATGSWGTWLHTNMHHRYMCGQ